MVGIRTVFASAADGTIPLSTGDGTPGGTSHAAVAPGIAGRAEAQARLAATIGFGFKPA